VHPDKNKAPAAEGAFKAVNAAYGCLSDPTLRRRYDQTGGEEDTGAPFQRRRQQHGGQRHNQFDGQDFANDIFEHFFGFQNQGRRPQQQAPPRRSQRTEGETGDGNQGATGILAFAPVVLMLLLLSTMMAGQTTNNNPFSLAPDVSFPTRRTTPSNLAYFVAPSFQRRYANDARTLNQIEAMVETQFLDTLRENCTLERKLRREAIEKARRYTGPDKADQLFKAYSRERESCDLLQAGLTAF
jgi:DnaJ family protein B protein 12